MKIKKRVLANLLLINLIFIIPLKAQQSLNLVYNEPAINWVEALPLGNGRIGAMVYGQPLEEKIQLNEATFWSGSPHNNLNDSASFYLDSIRRLQFQKKFKEAELLCNKYILSPKAQGMMYQPVGNLGFQLATYDRYTNYSRSLNLETAITTTSFYVGDIQYKREVFISHPDQVMVVRITASKAASISSTFYFETMQEGELFGIDNTTIKMSVTSPSHETILGGVKLQAYAKVVNEGGHLAKVGSSIIASKADAITIYVSLRTNYKAYNNLSANPELALNDVQQAAKKGYKSILKEHLTDYQQYFNRLNFQLGYDDNGNKPIKERLQNFQNDTSLAVLLFQFGRYLLISGSRNGGQPLTLQGLWNNRLRPSWDSKYTININTQMNYWPADVTNLSEMQEPLFGMIKDLSVTGAEAASKMYRAKGWMAHHNTDLWRTTGMVDGAQWGMWVTGGAWLGMHLWQHYLFTGDTNFLKSNYPIIKGMSEFLLDFLVKEPEHGYLVIAPSISPENSPKVNKAARINYGCTIDNQLLVDVFEATEKAAKITGNTDFELLKRITNAKKQLVPHQIGKYGQLQEWMWDWDVNDEDQAHISHLYGFYPSNQISYYRTPILAAAVRNSLLQRGDKNYTSWGRAWRIGQWARLHDGEQALYFLKTLLRPAVTMVNGGSLPNLFSSIGPIGNNIFQIEANLGATAGIAEMLLQSHDEAIDVLPALPKEWPNGKICGLKARGGFIIDMEWKEGQLSNLSIHSTIGGICNVRMPNVMRPINKVKFLSGKEVTINPFHQASTLAQDLSSEKLKLDSLQQSKTTLLSFVAKKGTVYEFVTSQNK